MKIHRPYPLYPLPPDYAELTVAGQKEARLATLRRQDTPQQLVAAWDLFRRLYLGGSKECVFYKKGFQESPDFHYDMVFDLGAHGRNVYAAPRGSAKSTVIAVEIPMFLSLTRKFYEIMLGMATDKLVEERFDQIMMQLETNELILQDFGESKPKRGRALWNHHHLHLTNGCIIKGLSVMGKKRGGRPNLFILDDPENDPDSDSETSRLALIEKFEVILFKQIIPMLESGSSAFWIGTLIDRKAFLYRATKGDDTRFDFWNRKVLRAMAHDPDDEKKVHLLWPTKWPEDVLEARKGEIGPSAFHSEYLNEPISPQDRILYIDPRKNEYTVEGEFDWSNPLAHNNKVKWEERVFEEDNDHRTYKELEKPFNELVRPMFKVLLFDYASGLTSHHDYACIAVCGFDTLATMWVLEVWLGRAKDDTLMRLIYEKGLAWQVRILGIEAVSIQKSFAEAVREYLNEQEGLRDDRWRGRVVPITYPSKETKPDRIASLEWRFNSGRIKYPAHLQNEWPYNQLYAQTHDFTKDLALLQHDDVIDALSMSKHVVKTRGGRFKRERGKLGLAERIKKSGPIVDGLPVLSGISPAEVSDEMMNILSKKAREKRIQPNQRRVERPRYPRLKRRIR